MNENALGQYLKQLRKAYGYTQEFVASHLNIIHQTYSHYETGRITPPTDSLYNLARLYNISIENLMTYTVNYQVPSDFISISPFAASDKDLNDFLEYIETPANQKKLKYMTHQEKRLLYYFQQLTPHNQAETLDILKVKCIHQQKNESNK